MYQPLFDSYEQMNEGLFGRLFERRGKRKAKRKKGRKREKEVKKVGTSKIEVINCWIKKEKATKKTIFYMEH